MHSGNLNLGNRQSHIIIARTDGAYGVRSHLIRLPYLYNTTDSEREEGMYFVGLVCTILLQNNEFRLIYLLSLGRKYWYLQ